MTDEPIAHLAKRPGVHDLHDEGQQVRFEVDANELPAVLRELSQTGLKSLTAAPPSLEQLLLRHYGDELNGHHTEKAGDPK